MTKEQEFKTRFAAVLQDLQQSGTKDAEAMWLLGSLASDLAGNLKATTWTAAKSNVSSKSYDALLYSFESQGTEHHAAGRKKHAYAIQALAVSLIAGTQRRDEQMAAGETLLDQIIDHSIALYRKAAKAN